MRLGLFFSAPGAGPEAHAAAAVRAEELGFDSVWVPDHVLRVFGPVLDPLTALAFLAGKTGRIKLGTGVLVAPYRHPVVLANVLSTLDVLSGGRLLFGVGVGWNAAEFEALGMHRGERGRRTDEILSSLERLWTGDPADFSGRFYGFRGAQVGVSPTTPGGPPVFVGGKSGAAMARTVRHGRGWMGFRDGPEDILAVRAGLDRAALEAGLDASGLQIGTTFDPEPGQEPRALNRHLDALETAGADLCALTLQSPTPESVDGLAEAVSPRLGT